eukprot:scaffold2394_cov276-Pinguiococcus_pyrenoidosus.AAC.9
MLAQCVHDGSLAVKGRRVEGREGKGSRYFGASMREQHLNYFYVTEAARQVKRCPLLFHRNVNIAPMMTQKALHFRELAEDAREVEVAEADRRTRELRRARQALHHRLVAPLRREEIGCLAALTHNGWIGSSLQ